MADLSNVLGGNWQNPQKTPVDPPEIQLRIAMEEMGIEPPDQIWMDGQVHRFASGTNGKSGHGDKSGWYVIFDGQVPAGRFGDWRADISSKWVANIGRELTQVEQMANARRLSEAIALRDAETKRKRDAAATTVEQIWADAGLATEDHPYLKRKGIGLHGARITGDGRLMVPLFDGDGKIHSLQYIGADGTKRYHTGGATGGMYWSLGDPNKVIYVAEGFATAATIQEVTGESVVVAYSASNLVPVSQTIKEKFPNVELVVVSDNDKSGIGQKYADQASAKTGARVVMPPQEGDVNDYAQDGGDVKELLTKPSKDGFHLVNISEMMSLGFQTDWLIKKYLTKESLASVVGASMAGKSFLAIDMALCIATGIPWRGNKVGQGPVVYIAGEGHRGLSKRIKAWEIEHGIEVKDAPVRFSSTNAMLVDKTSAEEVTFAINSMADEIGAPALVVIDTLHRNMGGDENSSQDFAQFLDNIEAPIKTRHKCCVMIIHHTGHDAGGRGRGSSAQRASYDHDFMLTKKEDISVLENEKNKDNSPAPEIAFELKQVDLGVIDEDGDAVTSCVLHQTEVPSEKTKTDKLSANRKKFENAWITNNKELDMAGRPFVSRSGMADYLESLGVKERTIRNYLNASYEDKLIGSLVISRVIEPFESGWSVIEVGQIAAMKMSADC
ncbi:MAG: AAA family ATPase [Gammaproteobacteria bacterium]|jgi:phage/plasmid primase-like uncharacterized protein|nr:AAA family ATPase [Gammaproteobacteria bacterium]